MSTGGVLRVGRVPTSQAIEADRCASLLVGAFLVELASNGSTRDARRCVGRGIIAGTAAKLTALLAPDRRETL